MNSYQFERTIEIPDPDSTWIEVEAFALTYNAYERRGGTQKVGRVFDKVAAGFEKNGVCEANVDDLRTCLFMTQRKSHWDWDIQGDPEMMALVRGVLLALREQTGGFVDGPGDEWP